MIRWYILNGDPLIPMRMIHAADKHSATQLSHTLGLGTRVMSVVEYEEIQREENRARRAQRRGRTIAREAEQMDYVLERDKDRITSLDAHYAQQRAWRGSLLYHTLRGEGKKQSDGFNQWDTEQMAPTEPCDLHDGYDSEADDEIFVEEVA